MARVASGIPETSDWRFRGASKAERSKGSDICGIYSTVARQIGPGSYSLTFVVFFGVGGQKGFVVFTQGTVVVKDANYDSAPVIIHHW